MDKLLTISDSPFVGPTPFEESDRDRFFGRHRETEELLSLIIAHRSVLVYAQSGTGKTSLVNAGVIPLLKRRSFKVLSPARVEGLISPQINHSKIGNIFAYHALRSFTETRETLVRSDLAGFLMATVPSGAQDDEAPVTTVLILDQFEEFFTCNAERWRERAPFFQQLGKALTNIRSLKVVFIMREEFLAQIEPFAELLPHKLRNRMYLERLREKPALAAIARPLKMRNLQFEPGAGEELVSDLCKIRVVDAGKVFEVPGEFVEPVHLQVVCQSIWRNLPEDWKKLLTSNAEGSPKITRAQVETFGDVNDALASYYQRAVHSASNNAGIHEGHLRRWIAESLITPSGTRGMVLSSSAATAGIPQKALEVLDRAHVIHAADQGGTAWYELTHDRFIEAIQVSNRQWSRSFGPAEETRKWLEDRATVFVDTGDLLDEVDLRAAEKFVATAEATALGLTARVNQLILRSRQVIKEKEQQRLLELQQANKQAELERQLRHRDRRNAGIIILCISCVACLVAYLLMQANQRLREQHRISNARFHRAQRDLQLSTPTHDAAALHDLAIALRYNPGNDEAAKQACELLTRHTWCPPLTAPLHYPAAAILGATFGPDGNIFAVSGDGKLLKCDQDSSNTLEPIDTLFNAAAADDQSAVIPPSAVFSENGTALLVILPRVVALNQANGIPRPGGPTEPVNPVQSISPVQTKAKIWKWHPKNHAYQLGQPEIQLQGNGPFFSVNWSSDASTLALITYQDNRPTCQVFQLDSRGAFTLNAALSNTLTGANVTAIAFSSNDRGEMATISLRNELQLFDQQFKLIWSPRKADTLVRLPRPAQLAFGPREYEFTITTWGAGVWKVDMHTGNVAPLHPKSFYDYHDQIARVVTSNEGSPHPLVATCLYSRITLTDTDMNELSEPIPISEPWVTLARFRKEGDELLTLSGSIWNASDTIRVTSLKMLTAPMATQMQFDGKNPPSWLAELADAVSGQQPDDEKSFWTVRTLYSRFSREVRTQQYDVIWDRFFSN